MNQLRVGVILRFIILLFLPFHTISQAESHYSIDQNNLWIGSEFGLFRYQTDNDQWSMIRSEPVTDLLINENILYVGTFQGIWYADTRYLNWKKYDKTNGLPSDSIIRILADLDFLYAASTHGIAKLDKLVGQWENFGDFSSTTIRDCYLDQQFLWVGTDNGIQVFEKQFNSWKTYTSTAGLISDTIKKIMFFNDYLWFYTDKGFSRFSPSMKTWNSYALQKDIAASLIASTHSDAEYIWAITDQGVFRFSAKNQLWEPLSDNSQIAKSTVKSLSTSGKTSWYATNTGIYSFNEEKRQWNTYTSIEGLGDDEQDEILCVGPTIISYKGSVFNVYFAKEDLWHSYTVAQTATAQSGGKAEYFNNEKGLGVKTAHGTSTSLLGKAYIKFKNKAEFTDPLLKNIADYILNKNMDSLVIQKNPVTGKDSIIAKIPRFKDFFYYWLKGQLSTNTNFARGNSFQTTFDNTDPLGALKYGITYTGLSEDFIRNFTIVSEQKSDYFYSSLISPTYYEGLNLRTEGGNRVGEKKRKRNNTGLWAGYRKTKYMKKLITFQEDNFYYLNVNNIMTESVELRVDGKFIDPRDYSIERTMGLLTFKNESIVTPDSRIEISCEYEPEIGKHTADMVAIENVIVGNDRISLAVNGLYRGIQEPDAKGTGKDTNRLAVVNVNGTMGYTSPQGVFSINAIPEISTSYNDSILFTKKGTAVKCRYDVSAPRFRLNGSTLGFSSQYESMADLSSVQGRMYYQTSNNATYDITEIMPLSAGFSLLNAASGKESEEHIEFLASPSHIPSLKLWGMHQSVHSSFKNPKVTAKRDSIAYLRLNGRVETEWSVPESITEKLHCNRLWFNSSYSINRSYDTLSDSVQTQIKDSSLFQQHIRHNLYTLLRISPHKKISFETKQVYRWFQEKTLLTPTWYDKQIRYLPEFSLYSPEFIPGITLYSKLTYEQSKTFYYSKTADTTGLLNKIRLNSSILFVPGVWVPVLNPLQILIGYNPSQEDSLNKKHTLSYEHDRTLIDTIKRVKGSSYLFYPIVNFTQNMRLLTRAELTEQKQFGQLLTTDKSISNTFESYMNDRATKLTIEYEVTNTVDYRRMAIDTTITGMTHESLIKWNQRWSSQFRSEIPLKLGWQKSDTLIHDTAKIIHSYTNRITPSVLIDWRHQGSTIRDLRLQYQIGLSLYEGTFLNLNSYHVSLDNKVDFIMKLSRNLLAHMLLNMSYNYADKVFKYDLAEFKITALF